MPQYIFHIGPHKTGSTYLQNTFCALRSELAKRGISYPTIWQTFLTGHHALAAELRAKKLDALRAGFQSLSSENIVVFSSEEFSTLDLGSLTILKELVGSNKVKIIFYCRRWSELLPSCWQEDIKQGSSDTLPEYYTPHLADPLRSNILNFCLVLDRFASIFGIEAINIVSYNNLSERKEDLFKKFLSEILNVQEDGLAIPPPSFPNASLDYLDVEIIRVLNTLSQKLDNVRSATIRGLYLKQKAQLDLRYISEQIDAGRTRVRIDDGAYALHCLFSYINDKYRDNIIGAEKSIFSQQQGRPYVYIRQGYLLNSRVVDEFQDLYAKIKGSCSSSSPESNAKLERAGKG
jgi:hypothetical protein